MLGKLNRFEYFRKAYEPQGLRHEEFNRHPATVATAMEFSKATDEMESFVQEAIKGADIKSKVAVLV